jgi:uncharacterized membrane protein
MNVSDIFQRATAFGTFRSRSSFASFALKILFYILPAVLLGYSTDRFIKILKKEQVLGKNLLFYILTQTFLIIATVYILFVFLVDFMSEFQVTFAGGFFIVLYFGIQLNYIQMIQTYMDQHLPPI